MLEAPALTGRIMLPRLKNTVQLMSILSLKTQLSEMSQVRHKMRIKELGFMPLHSITFCGIWCASCNVQGAAVLALGFTTSN